MHLSKLRSIQVLRGVAACAVVLLHARYFGGSPIDHSWARLGAAGVDLFFVISGFIMATIAKPSAGRFLFDRFWRIFPLWLVAVTPWLIALRPGPSIIAASLTLWPVYHQFTTPALVVGWTLSFELLFYIAMAVAMRTRPTVPLALFGVALLAGSLTHAPIFDYLGNPMIFEFLFGVGIARLPRREQWGWPLLAASALGFALSPLGLYEHHSAIDASRSLLRVVSWGLPAAFAVYGVLCAERWLRSGWFVPLVLLGDASYSIYLFHRLTTFVPVDWPLKFPICVAFGVCIHLLVERPIIKLKPRFRARRSDTGAPQEVAPAIRISA